MVSVVKARTEDVRVARVGRVVDSRVEFRIFRDVLRRARGHILNNSGRMGLTVAHFRQRGLNGVLDVKNLGQQASSRRQHFHRRSQISLRFLDHISVLLARLFLRRHGRLEKLLLLGRSHGNIRRVFEIRGDFAPRLAGVAVVLGVFRTRGTGARFQRARFLQTIASNRLGLDSRVAVKVRIRSRFDQAEVGNDFVAARRRASLRHRLRLGVKRLLRDSLRRGIRILRVFLRRFTHVLDVDRLRVLRRRVLIVQPPRRSNRRLRHRTALHLRADV